MPLSLELLEVFSFFHLPGQLSEEVIFEQRPKDSLSSGHAEIEGHSHSKYRET